MQSVYIRATKLTGESAKNTIKAWKSKLAEAAIIDIDATALLEVINDKRFVVKAYDLEGLGFEKNEPHYMFIVQGHNDRVLQKYGKEYGFSRGGAYIWTPLQFNIQGFFPKFENDDNDDVSFLQDPNECNTSVKSYGLIPDPSEIVSLIDRLISTGKVSGFLGIAIFIMTAYETLGYLGMCKNSAGEETKFQTEVNKVVKEIVSKFSEEDCAEIKKRGLYFGFEIISPRDMHHGAKPVQPHAVGVVTCVCRSVQLGIEKPGQKRACLHTPLPVEEAHKIAIRMKLDILSKHIIIGPTAIRDFQRLIHESRDYMTDERYNEIMSDLTAKHPGNVTVMVGTVTHKDLLGSRLEGFVMFYERHSTDKDGNDVITIEMKKVKNPNYTLGTMGLRVEIENLARPTKKHEVSIERLVDRWTVSKRGKAMWTAFLNEAFAMAHKEFDPSDPNDGDGSPTLNIRIFDKLNEVCDIRSRYFDPCYDCYDCDDGSAESAKSVKSAKSAKIAYFAGFIRMFLGPYAAGKTTAAKQYVEELGKKIGRKNVCYVDADVLDLPERQMGVNLTEKIGYNRNHYTMWKVVEGLLRGQVVVVSCSFQMENIRSFLEKSFPKKQFHIAAVVPEDLDEAYRPDRVREGLVGRATFDDALVARLVNNLVGHRAALEKVLCFADSVSTFRPYDPNDPDARLVDSMSEPPAKPEGYMFRHTAQMLEAGASGRNLLAFLAWVDPKNDNIKDGKHVTIKYDSGQRITNDTLAKFSELVGRTANGIIVTGTPSMTVMNRKTGETMEVADIRGQFSVAVIDDPCVVALIPRAHVTLDTKRVEAREMGAVAEAWRQGDRTISLPDKAAPGTVRLYTLSYSTAANVDVVFGGMYSI